MDKYLFSSFLLGTFWGVIILYSIWIREYVIVYTHVRRTCKRPGSPPRTSISAYTQQGSRCEMSTPVSSAQKRTKTERARKTVRARNATAERCMNKYHRSAEHNERELCKMLTHRPKAISLARCKIDIVIWLQCSAVKWPVACRIQVFMD